jgi:hypothetical protein
MTNPDLLILDEATEGLAPLIAREIWRIWATSAPRHRRVDRRDKNYGRSRRSPTAT